jgi:hypothetical protein
MPIRRSATRIAVVVLLTAAGGLALSADQFSALAQRLEDALRGGLPDAEAGKDRETEDAEAAAARAEGEGYPLGRAGGKDRPQRR